MPSVSLPPSISQFEYYSKQTRTAHLLGTPLFKETLVALTRAGIQDVLARPSCTEVSVADTPSNRKRLAFLIAYWYIRVLLHDGDYSSRCAVNQCMSSLAW